MYYVVNTINKKDIDHFINIIIFTNKLKYNSTQFSSIFTKFSLIFVIILCEIIYFNTFFIQLSKQREI